MPYSILQFVQRHWLGLIFAVPVAVYAAWISSMVVPEIVKAIVPAVVRGVVSR